MRALAEDMERRDEGRVYRELACKLLVEGRCRRAVVRDLSVGGLLLEIAEELPAGAAVVVAFGTPEGERFVLEGSTRRRTPVAQSVHVAHAAPSVAVRLHAPPVRYRRWVTEARRSGS
ncbi:MAG: PilZ domain-containing protein [Myxococcota bacterium]|nr:PilZ domain-containing protein [Myxococcota bacterium]